jgi:class 3 adenylate cyclase
MAISVRLFLAIVTAIVGITAAAVAFAPVYTSAMTSVKDVVESLRGEIGARIESNVGEFFSMPQLLVSSLMLSAKLGGMNTSDKFSMIPWFGSISNLSGLSTYAGFEDASFLSVNAVGQSSPDIVSVSMTTGIGSGTSYAFAFNMTERNTSNLPTPTANSYNPTIRPWYKPLLAAQSWSPVYLDSSGDYAVLTVGGPFQNSTGNKFGAFALDFPTTIVLAYLRQQSVGKTGRVMLLDRQSQGFLGGNWQVASSINVSGVLHMATLPDVASSDGNVQNTYASLGVSYLLNCTAPCKATIGSGVSALYVDVLAVTDKYGLDMRLVVMLPAKDFLDKVDKDSKVSIGATVAAVVALLIIAVIVGQIALAPLSQLEERLYAAASLSDDADDEAEEGCNFLSEIVNIENAFKTLRAELARVKSFVPQSVLQRMDDGEADEDMVQEFSATQSESSKHSRRESTVPSGIHQSRSKSDMKTVKSKRSSAASRARERKGGAVLNVTSGLVSRQVTLLTANIVGFHAACADSVSACTTIHNHYLDIVCAAAAKNRGVVDSFSGDRVFISFNASNNVATHATRSAATICGIEEGIRKLPASDKMAVRLAAATGRVLAGNMGNNIIKRFSLVGSTVTQSVILLQLAKMWNVSNLVTSTSMDTMEFEYHVEAVGVATLPSNTEKGGRKMVIGSVLSAKAGGEAEEWMYELNTGGTLEKDLATLKESFQQLLIQPNATAQVAEKAGTIHTTSLVGYMRLQALLKQPDPPLGLYYDALCGAAQ